MKKKVLITGASSGVGKSLTRYLGERGFLVIAIARRKEKLKEFFNGYENIVSYNIDLSDIIRLERKLDNIVGQFGYIPYIINNAGVNISASLEGIDKEGILQSFLTNALAPVVIMKKVLPKMMEHNFGRVINVTSGAPLNCFAGFGAYSASKAALNAFSITAAREYLDYDIKINLMSPGPVRTEMAPKGPMDPSVCHPTVDYLLNLDENGPTGRFFWLGYEVPLFPDLDGVDWLKGDGHKKLKKVI